MDTSHPSPEPAQTPEGTGACTPESCPHCGHQCGRAPQSMAELRAAALAEVMKAGIDASKDITWQIRCGKTQSVEYARVSRAVRLTVILSAKLEADPKLAGFRPKIAFAMTDRAADGLDGLSLYPARAKAKRGGDAESFDRESYDRGDVELDELERDLADERPVAEILKEACTLMGRKVDLSALESRGAAVPAPVAAAAAPAPKPAEVVLTPEERERIVAQLEAYMDRPRATGAVGRKTPDG